MRFLSFCKTWPSRFLRLRVLTLFLLIALIYFLSDDEILSKFLPENNNIPKETNNNNSSSLIADEEIGSGEDEDSESNIPGIDSIDLTGGVASKIVHHEKPSGSSVGGSGIYVAHDLHQNDPEETEYISQISKRFPKEITNEIIETAKNPTILSESNLPALMYYNRIPKCGSTSLGNLLNATGEENNRFEIKHEHYRGIRFSFKNEKEKKV